MVKYYNINNLNVLELTDMLELEIRRTWFAPKKDYIYYPAIKSVITFDTETSTVDRSMDEPLIAEFEIEDDVWIKKEFDTYGFICAWSIAITNDGINYYSILGRSTDDFNHFCDLFLGAKKEVLFRYYNNLFEKADEKKRESIKNKIRNIEKYFFGYSKECRMYIHNISYDYAYIKDFIGDKYDLHKFGKPTKMFKVALNYTTDCKNKNGENKTSSIFTIYDSLKYFDNKLDNIQSNIFNKTDGWDYDKFRTTTTPLTADEEEYVRNDTLKLSEVLYTEAIQQFGSIHDMPLTKTGIVRNYIKGESIMTARNEDERLAQAELYNKDALEMVNRKKKLVTSLKNQLNKTEHVNWSTIYDILVKLNIVKYDDLLHILFEGGVCQGNKETVKKITSDIYSYDVASMYPALMLVMKYVRRYDTKLNKGDNIINNTYSFWDYLSHKVTKGWIGIVHFDKIQLKKNGCNIYDLADNKVMRIKEFMRKYYNMNECNALNAFGFNGKIKYIEDVYYPMSDIDMSRLLLNYEVTNPTLICGYLGEYEELMPSLRSTVLILARNKMKAKEIVGKLEKDGKKYSDEWLKAKADESFHKKNFNSTFGTTCENKKREVLDELKENLLIDSNEEIVKTKEYKKKYSEYLLKEYFNSYMNFKYENNSFKYEVSACKNPIPYEYGVEITSYARLYLMTFNTTVEDPKYSDTDSSKTSTTPDKIEVLNKKFLSIVYENYPELESFWGKKPLGVWECEAKIADFIHYNSKRYIYTQYDKDGDIIQIYNYFDSNGEIIPRYTSKFKELKAYGKKLDNRLSSIEYTKNKEMTKTEIENCVKLICKHFNLTYKVNDELTIKFAGIDGAIIEFMLYQKYNNTNERMNKLFDSDNKLTIEAKDSKKLTHTYIDLLKIRHNGKIYMVKDIRFIRNKYNAGSCMVLLPQMYCTTTITQVDKLSRISTFSDSLIESV